MKNRQVRRAGRGFTLLETMIAVTLAIAVIVGVLSSFDMGSKTSIVQRDLAELQQSVRASLREITRQVRPTGRGGLLGARAIAVEQNVAHGTELAGQAVLPETDVLTLRGVFTSPLFHVDSSDEQSFTNDGVTATLIIDSQARSGYRQPLDSLKELVASSPDGLAEPIILVSRTSAAVYAVVEVSSITFSTVTGPRGEVERATLSLQIDPGSGQHTGEYLALSTGGGFRPTFDTVLLAGVVEEYRYFVRQDNVVAGDLSSPPSPKLTRVRMVPGTDLVHPADSSLQDVADDIFDLQVALGIDLDADGRVEEFDESGNRLSKTEDEWRYNDPADPGDATWGTLPPLLVRVNLLGQANRPDRTYISEAIDAIEDHVYDEGMPQTSEEIAARRHRRRLAQGLIELRNL